MYEVMQEECTERVVTAMEELSKGTVVFEATMYKNKYGRQWLERGCGTKEPKMFIIDKHCGYL